MANRGRRTAPPPIDYHWVDEQSELDRIATELIDAPRYALDTEFHRERTYYPKLALVQVAWHVDGAQRLALIDPLAVDVKAFDAVFGSPALCVAHAAQQDLDVLTHSVGSVPQRLFDTQLAAGFVGYGTPSLVSLLQGELGVTPAKGDRLTDWLRRPLTDAQKQYAAVDVEYLLEVHDRLVAQLAERGRIDWALDACEELRTRPVSGAEPEHAWLKIRDARTLRPAARAVACSVAAWRERRAMRTDVPARHVLPDLAVLGIAQRRPQNATELLQARGVDERHSRGALGEEILEAVRAARDATAPDPPPSVDDLDRNLRPAITLISAWVSQLARDEAIDNALLATRADIVAFLRGDDDARLASGWRADLLGDGIRALTSGRAGLTFDGDGRLKLLPASDSA
ncbi:MAG: HRDC domain-containing protein [Actinomycetota bacterium]